MKLSEFGEIEFLREIERRFGAASPRGGARVKKGIGDDTSVTAGKKGYDLLATTDTLVESVHFSLAYTPPRLLGRKAVSVSLSDIAAMGGKPLFLLVALSLPSKLDIGFARELYKGIGDVCKEFSVELIGGNTTSSPRGSGISITTTVLGEVERGRAVLRSSARVGEGIYVTGTLGDSALGLKLLKKAKGIKEARGGARALMTAHLDPRPRVEAGARLAGTRVTRSMMDISDGLLIDLKRLLDASKVGAEVFSDEIPVSNAFKKNTSKNESEKLSLTGGEDYELLFTAREKDARRIFNISKKLGIPITKIGTITKRRGFLSVLDKNGRQVELKKLGYEHFS